MSSQYSNKVIYRLVADTCEIWEGMSGMLSPALLATLITISEAPPEDRKQASLIETHLPELMM